MNRRDLFYFMATFAASIATTAILTPATFAAEKPSELFKSGIARYASGDPEAALEYFEHPAFEDKEAPGIYYNIGNASYASGRVGKAIWAFERALLLEPRARDIRKNLARAYSRASDINGGVPPTNFFEGISAAARWVSAEEAALFFSVVWGIWIVAVIARFFMGWWVTSGVALFRIALGVVVVAGSLFAVKVADRVTPRAVIAASEVHARFGPAAADGKAFGLKEGRLVRILNASQEWWFVADAEGRSGWIPADTALRIDREYPE